MDRWEFWDQHFKDYYKEDIRVEPRDDFLDEIRTTRNHILFLVNWDLNVSDEALEINFLEHNPDIHGIEDLKEIIDVALEKVDGLKEKVEKYVDECAKKCLKNIFDGVNMTHGTPDI